FAEQKKAQDARIKQEQRAGVIDRLLNDANTQGEKPEVEGTPVKEVAPAKYSMRQRGPLRRGCILPIAGRALPRSERYPIDDRSVARGGTHKKSRGIARSHSRRQTSFAPSHACKLPCSRKTSRVHDSRISVSIRICHASRDTVDVRRSSATALSGSFSST